MATLRLSCLLTHQLDYTWKWMTHDQTEPACSVVSWMGDYLVDEISGTFAEFFAHWLWFPVQLSALSVAVNWNIVGYLVLRNCNNQRHALTTTAKLLLQRSLTQTSTIMWDMMVKFRRIFSPGVQWNNGKNWKGKNTTYNALRRND